MAEKRQSRSTTSKTSSSKSSGSSGGRSSSRSSRSSGSSGGGLLGAPQELFERMQNLTEAVVSTGSDALGKVAGPLPGAASEVLTTLRSTIVQMPSPTASLDLILEEVKAKRALTRAMIVQMESFDAQLEILEKSLTPLQEWGQQWTALQSAVLEPLRPRK